MAGSVAMVALLLMVLATAAAAGAAAGDSSSSSRSHSTRSLLAFPVPVPEPFAFPKDIGEAARAQHGTPDAFANSICGIFARRDVQGSREFRDVDSSKIYPMFKNYARAAYLYPDTVDTLAQALEKCNNMGGMAAEGVGYGIAFIYAKGIVEGWGLTTMLESVYDKAGGCSSLNNIMDIAAAVIKARDVALDELHNTLKTWSPKLASCTPKDAQLRFRAYSLRGDVSQVKARRSSTQPMPDPPAASGSSSNMEATPASRSRGSAGSGSGSGGNKGAQQPAGAVVYERGQDVSGR